MINKQELQSIMKSNKRHYQIELRNIVNNYLKEVASLGANKTILDKDEIVNNILYFNQDIVDELRKNGIEVTFDYGRVAIITWG